LAEVMARPLPINAVVLQLVLVVAAYFPIFCFIMALCAMQIREITK